MKPTKIQQIGITAVFAATYAALGYLFAPISFLAIQVRVADAILPLMALFGWPSLIGAQLGLFILNLSSPLGLIDMTPIFVFIPPSWLVVKYGVKAVPVYVACIGVWVGIELFLVYNVPLLLTMLYVGIGESIAQIGIGFPLYYAVKRRLGLK